MAFTVPWQSCEPLQCECVSEKATERDGGEQKFARSGSSFLPPLPVLLTAARTCSGGNLRLIHETGAREGALTVRPGPTAATSAEWNRESAARGRPAVRREPAPVQRRHLGTVEKCNGRETQKHLNRKTFVSQSVTILKVFFGHLCIT